MLLLSPAPTCQIREHRRLQVRLRFEMDHEDQRVADYPERGDYRYDDAVADDAPDVRLDDPQTVVRVLSEMSQGFWSEINSRQSWVIGRLAPRCRSPFAKHDHVAHLGNIRDFHRAPFCPLLGHSRREVSTHFLRGSEALQRGNKSHVRRITATCDIGVGRGRILQADEKLRFSSVQLVFEAAKLIQRFAGNRSHICGSFAPFRWLKFLNLDG